MSEGKPFDIETASAFLQATARNSGLTFDPDKLTTAAAQLAETVERTADGALAYTNGGFGGAFRIVNGATVEIELGEHVAGIVRRNTKPLPASTPAAHGDVPEVPAAPSSAPLWAQRISGSMSEFARALAAREDAALIRETETWANPWLPGALNRTKQQIILNRNPALAARYKAQAGAK